MMIVDDREGSKELVPVLSRIGTPVKAGRLEFGDCQFLGRGPEGRDVLIGIEYKKLGDLLQSWYDGRLMGHQLPGMMNSYEIIYLVVEGVWSCDESGELRILRGNHWRKAESGTRYHNLVGWLNSLAMVHGVYVTQTPNLLSTGVAIASIYSWWQKEYSSHGQAVYVHSQDLTRKLFLPTPVQKTAATFPGVGAEKLVAVANRFKSIREMVNATPQEWQEIEGIGKKTAERIVNHVS